MAGPLLRVLSLGGGVQSTTLALMAAHGEIRLMPECAIFADLTPRPPSSVHRQRRHAGRELAEKLMATASLKSSENKKSQSFDSDERFILKILTASIFKSSVQKLAHCNAAPSGFHKSAMLLKYYIWRRIYHSLPKFLQSSFTMFDLKVKYYLGFSQSCGDTRVPVPDVFRRFKEFVDLRSGTRRDDNIFKSRLGFVYSIFHVFYNFWITSDNARVTVRVNFLKNLGIARCVNHIIECLFRQSDVFPQSSVALNYSFDRIKKTYGVTGLVIEDFDQSYRCLPTGYLSLSIRNRNLLIYPKPSKCCRANCNDSADQRLIAIEPKIKTVERSILGVVAQDAKHVLRAAETRVGSRPRHTNQQSEQEQQERGEAPIHALISGLKPSCFASRFIPDPETAE